MNNAQLKDTILRLGDDAMILAQRLGEWCGHAPILEEDIALTNIALDLIGQTQSYYTLAGQLNEDGVKTDDELAFFRTDVEYQNLLIVEQPNGHFGDTIIRQFLFDNFALLRAQHLASQTVNEDVAAIAAKAVKEIRYHADHSGKWVRRLGDGTKVSHDKIQDSLKNIWKYTGEMFTADDTDKAAIEAGLLPDFDIIKSQWNSAVDVVLKEAGLDRPKDGWMQQGGRKGVHTEHLGYILAEMQVLPRTYPDTTW